MVPILLVDDVERQTLWKAKGAVYSEGIDGKDYPETHHV